MQQLLSLFIIILIFYYLMKYIFKFLFGLQRVSSNSLNFFDYFFLKSFQGFFNFITGRKNKGLMGSFEESRFINSFNKGLVLNGEDKRLSLKDSFNHLAVIARTGGGKTSSYIIPNILKLAQDKNSLVVTDLSGELFEKTSGFLAKRGFKIYVLDPEDLKTSIRYNPLYYASSSLEIDEIAEILIKSANPGQIKAEDKMWLDGAKTFLTILIKVLVATKDYRYINLANLKHLINHFADDGSPLDELIFKYADKRTFSEWKGFVSGNLRTIQSFVSTANTALNAIGINDNLALLTANHNINFENFRKEKSIIYIRIPAQKQEQYSFLLNLFYKQFFNSMMKDLPTKKDLPIFCLLDEFGNMSIPNFSTTITTIRKYKVSISIVLQDFSQLEQKYGKSEAHTIINGGITGKLFFSGADLQITNMLTQIIGDRYVNKIDEFGRVHHIKEPILSNADIRTMKDNELLLIYGNKLPLNIKTKPYYKNFILNSFTKYKPFESSKNSYNDILEYIEIEVN